MNFLLQEGFKPCYICGLEMIAQVAELVDAHASGACVLPDVEVRVLSWAPKP